MSMGGFRRAVAPFATNRAASAGERTRDATVVHPLFNRRNAVNTRPKVIISKTDADRLNELLASLPDNAFPGMAELEGELERAEIVDSKDMPSTVVTMNSKVRFRVSSSQTEFCLTLVYPKDVDASGGTISILAPVGSALLGLSQGDEIEWPRPGGGKMRVRIEEVVYQPERSGDYHL